MHSPLATTSLLLLLLLPCLLTTATPISISAPSLQTIPSVHEAAHTARLLLARESIATLSTIFPHDGSPRTRGREGYPIGLMDYYADCSPDGNPTLLSMKIATTFKNVAAGSKISLSVRDHSYNHPDSALPRSAAAEEAEAATAGGEYPSPAAHPRVSILGYLEKVHFGSPVEEAKLKLCFARKHKDAVFWMPPGDKVHEAEWVRLVVESVFFVGGFGNVAYIGDIPVEVWGNVTLSEEERREAGVWAEEEGGEGEGFNVQDVEDEL